MLVNSQTYNTRMAAIKAEIARCIAEAMRLYSVDLKGVQVSYNMRGKTAGYAARKRGIYMLKLNREMIGGPEDAYTGMLKDTVSHEFAHLICFAKPELGRNHDHGWKRVHHTLGGTGKRCHSIDVGEIQGGYYYLTSTGHVIEVGKGRHNKLHRNPGFQYAFKKVGAVSSKSPHLYRKPGQPAPTSRADFDAKELAPVAIPHVTIRTPKSLSYAGLLGMLGLNKHVAPPTAPVQAPVRTAPPVRISSSGTMSKADRVRLWIREAKRDNRSQGWVMEMAQMHLQMPKGQAYRYVTENWPKV